MLQKLIEQYFLGKNIQWWPFSSIEKHILLEFYDTVVVKFKIWRWKLVEIAHECTAS